MADLLFIGNPAGLSSSIFSRKNPSTSLSRSSRRQSTCSVRASSAAPPPPPPPAENSSGNQGDDSGTGDIVALARAELEASFGLDIEANESGNDGKCDCIWCSGSGKRTCAWCRGTGQRDEFRTQSWNEMNDDVERYVDGEPVQMPERIPTVCSACTGTKLLRCGKCRGSGIGSYGMGYSKK